jgi:hypothetical protein
MKRLLDYRFGPLEKSGDHGQRGVPAFCARQVLMLPAMSVYVVSLLLPKPLGAFIGAIACAAIDMAWGQRPRWDFKDQMELRK